MSVGQSITAQLELHRTEWETCGDPRPIGREPMTWELADVAPGLYAWRVIYRWAGRAFGVADGRDMVRERDVITIDHPVSALSTLGA